MAAVQYNIAYTTAGQLVSTNTHQQIVAAVQAEAVRRGQSSPAIAVPTTVDTITSSYINTIGSYIQSWTGVGYSVSAGQLITASSINVLIDGLNLAGSDPLAISIDILAVGGGGAGGTGANDNVGGGGGGGGGGGVYYTTVQMAANTFALDVVVGAGGAPGPYMSPIRGGNGGNTTISGSISASAGGGYGGWWAGGKWAAGVGTPGAYGGGYGGSPNGSAGGGYAANGQSNGIGAGGGSGSVDDSWARTGGNGYRWPQNNTYYGGGGGGGGDNHGVGGLGGGGGTNVGSLPGLAGLGGGGCGGSEWNAGWAGGSGVVIVSYTGATQQFNGGNVTVSGSGAGARWFHTFPYSGALRSNVGTTPFVFNQTISTNTANYSLTTAAAAAGWDQVSALVAAITINPGVTVYSTTSSSAAVTVSSNYPLSSGSSVSIVNNGSILGAGGAGGQGELPSPSYYPPVSMGAGGAGGPGVKTTFPITITNNGTIAGGGGGGGGSGGLVYIDADGNAYSSTPGAGGGVGQGIAAATGNGGARGQSGSIGSGTTYDSSGYVFTNGTGGAGGLAGAAVQGNSYVTWLATGTRFGPLT